MRTFFIFHFSFFIFHFSASAQLQDAGLETNLPAFKVLLKSEEVVGGTKAKPVQRVFLNSGTNKFMFLAPLDFRVDASEPDKIVMSSPEYGCFISVQFVEPVKSESGAVPPEAWRNLALGDFPGAVITSEFAMNAANHSGPAFELQWANSTGLSQSGCAAFIPLAAGVLEFKLLAHADKYPDGRYFFNSLLLGFRSNESGKLEILPIPGNS